MLLFDHCWQIWKLSGMRSLGVFSIRVFYSLDYYTWNLRKRQKPLPVCVDFCRRVNISLHMYYLLGWFGTLDTVLLKVLFPEKDPKSKFVEG